MTKVKSKKEKTTEDEFTKDDIYKENIKSEPETEKQEKKPLMYVKKITCRSVCGIIKKFPEGKLFDLVGNVSECKEGQSDYGPYTIFKGDFMAIRADGTIYRSRSLLMPEIAEELILSGFEQAKDDDDGGFINLSIGIRLTKIVDENSTVGYIYGVEALIQMEDNLLVDLRAKAGL